MELDLKMKSINLLNLKVLIAIGLLISSLAPITQAQAQSFPQCNAGSCRGLVGRVLFDSSGQLFIAVTGANIGSLTNCNATNGLARVPSTDPNQRSLYALALTAFSLQQPVQVAIVQGSANCDVAFLSLFTG